MTSPVSVMAIAKTFSRSLAWLVDRMMLVREVIVAKGGNDLYAFLCFDISFQDPSRRLPRMVSVSVDWRQGKPVAISFDSL